MESYNQLYGILKDKENILLSRPMPAPIDKIQNRYRWRIIIKGNMTDYLNEVCNNLLKQIYSKNQKEIRVTIDVNPNNMI